MKFYTAIAPLLLLLFFAPLAHAGELDYLALLAEDSEIKAIGEVASIKRVSGSRDGTFIQVTFKRIYAVTPYIPKNFVGGCKTLEYSWQKRSGDMVYFKPRKGQRVFVTITTNGGAITSYTPMNPRLEAAIHREPHRLAYSRGRASVTPKE